MSKLGSFQHFKCDRCGREDQSLGQGAQSPVPSNWAKIMGYDLCAQCVNEVGDFIDAGVRGSARV